VKSENKIEFAAIPIVAVTLGILFVLFLAYDQGLWAWLLVGALAIVLAVLVARSVGKRTRHPSLEAAPRVSPADAPRDGVHRVLVIADESVTSEAFRSTLTAHAAGRPLEAYVVAPALSSRLARWTSDESAYRDAQEHLDETIASLTGAGITAHGEIGPHDPLQAADDGLREFAANEVVFATRPEDGANWLEEGVVDQARSRYGIPVAHLVVEPSGR
jgi:GABA permease